MVNCPGYDEQQSLAEGGELGARSLRGDLYFFQVLESHDELSLPHESIAF